MRLDLIRHGRTTMPGVLLGHTDAAATEESAADLIRQTDGRTWSAVVASSLRRSHAFAERLAHERGLMLRIDSDWCELDFGDWDGRSVEVLRADPAIAAHLDAFYRDADTPAPPGGESWRVLETRTLCALKRLLDTDTSGSALVVTHGGPIRAALSLACGLPFASTWAFRIDYATRVTLDIARASDGKIWGEIVEVAQP